MNIASNQITAVLGKFLVLFALSGFCVSAFAHTGLKSSHPANGAVVQTTPEQMNLTFTAEVALVKLTLTDAAGKQIKLDFTPSTDTKTEHLLAMPQLQTGQYKVDWAVIGADGHTVSNSFGFAVDPTATASHGHGDSDAGGGHGH